MLNLNKKGFLVGAIAVLLLGAVFLSGCIDEDTKLKLKFKEIERFESYDAMVAAFEEARTSPRGYGLIDGIAGIAVPLAAPSAAQESGKAADTAAGVDYSKTNIQVEGVDEADIVKSDGKFIYNFSKNKLIITDAYPIESAKIVSQTKLEEVFPQEMFVLEDKLLVFGTKTRYYLQGGITADMPPPYYGGGRVVVQLYDVSNRAEPVLEKELEFEGNYLTSRLIKENAYFVVNSYPRWNILKEEDAEEGFIPLMVEDGVEKQIAEPTDIGILPPMPPTSFVTIASLNLNSKEVQTETIGGSAQSVFASPQSIYIAAGVWMPPETPVIGEVERIIVGDSEKTVVNKFGLADGEIGFLGQGSVPGHVLNQFSMDEFEGKFRVATTVGQVSRMGSQSKNNLYVLDEEMNTIGILEDLAPGEKIYSARFMGKRAYMVTFKKVDPLFVIDVSDPYNPRVLGKLKIPGYSDYLHPIDEGHLIGVGKETIEAKEGDFAWYQGLKMAVFDVSDVENPKEMHKIVIGDRGTDSYALRDHKAFLYDKEKELLVLPIMLAEIPEEQKKPLDENRRFPRSGTPVFQGAFVFRLTLENGFEERGRISHTSAEEELKRGYYFGDDYSVKRALYIGNVLYTLSGKMLKANALDTLESLKEFVFE